MGPISNKILPSLLNACTGMLLKKQTPNSYISNVYFMSIYLSIQKPCSKEMSECTIYQMTKAEMMGIGVMQLILPRHPTLCHRHCFFWWLFKGGCWTALGLPVPWLCCDSPGSIRHLEDCFSFPHILGALFIYPLSVFWCGLPRGKSTGWFGEHRDLSVSSKLPWWLLPLSCPSTCHVLFHLAMLRWQQLCSYDKSPETVSREKMDKGHRKFSRENTQISKKNTQKEIDPIAYQRMLNYQ